MSLDNKTIIQIGITTNIIEWYVFCIYGYLPKEIGDIFFNASNDTEAMLLTFSTFALSYFARPLGSLFFGYVGDIYGRGRSLRLATLIMVIPATFIGLLPTYEQVGYFSPALLIVLRLIQGFASGGELPGTACYIYEISARENRALFCGSVSISSMLGVLLGSFIVTLLHFIFNEKAILTGAWRIPFLLAIPLTFWILHIRKKIIEPPILNKELNEDNIRKKHLILSIFQAILLVSFLQVCFYILFVWMPVYLEYFLKIPAYFARLSNVVTLLSFIIFTLLMSYLSRFVNSKKMIIFGISSVVIFSYPLFFWMSYKKQEYEYLLISQLLLTFFVSSISGVIMEVLGNFFPRKVRNTGMNISFTFASSLFGATAPIVCNYYITSTGLIIFPAIYMIIFGCLAFFSIQYIERRYS